MLGLGWGAALLLSLLGSCYFARRKIKVYFEFCVKFLSDMFQARFIQRGAQVEVDIEMDGGNEEEEEVRRVLPQRNCRKK